MWRDKIGEIIWPMAVDWLRFYKSVYVLLWAHAPKYPDDFFVREVDTSESILRAVPLNLNSDMVVLSKTIERLCSSSRGRWVEYTAVNKADLALAHPSCKVCYGTGIATRVIYCMSTDHVCTCVRGKSYWVSIGGKKLQLPTPRRVAVRK